MSSKLTRLLAVIFALSLLAAACGSDDASDVADNAAATDDAADVVEADEEARS